MIPVTPMISVAPPIRKAGVLGPQTTENTDCPAPHASWATNSDKTNPTQDNRIIELGDILCLQMFMSLTIGGGRTIELNYFLNF